MSEEVPKEIANTRIGKRIQKVRNTNLDELQKLVVKKLQEMSANDRLAFEFVLKMPWSNIVQTYSSLSNKSYDELKKMREPIMTLGDLSGSDIGEITSIVMLNELYYKDPKVEMYLIARFFNTRFSSRLSDRLRGR